MMVLVLAALLTTPRAHASDLGAALDRFTADSFADTVAGIEQLAQSGTPESATLLEALADGRLLVDAATKSVFYKSAAGTLIDARTGANAASPPADLAPVRLNNRVRSTLQSAMSRLGILAADPAKRLAAARALLKSRNAAALPVLETALAKENDRQVRSVMELARAVIVLGAPQVSEADRLSAIGLLETRGDEDLVPLLRASAANASPALRNAAETAIRSIENRARLIAAAQNIWYGLSLGSVLLLAAAGLAITFGVMGVINMAHGEMVMLGAYSTFVVQEAFRALAPGAIDFALLVALPAAFVITGLVGIAIERGIIRFLYGRPLETLLATWGVSLVLQQAIRDRFGASNVQVSSPTYMSGSFEFLGLAITWGRLWIVVFTLIAFAALQLAIRATPLGLQMRAVTQNRRMSSAMGIRTGRIDALTFGLGSGIAGIAGVALSQIDNVAPNLGQSYIIDCFMVVVFGGVGNLWGTLVSAFSLGIANKLLEPVAGAVLAKIAILVLLILFIQKRPRGLFALKGRAVEA
jgi:urea transport system permease protein